MSFEGSASAAIDFPLHFSIGPLRIDGLHVGLSPSDAGIGLETSFAASTSLGPLTVSIDRVGALAMLAFHDGNLGPGGCLAGFQAAVGDRSGGGGAGGRERRGLSFHDAPTATYAGVMQLSIYEQLTLTAFGLIATRMPDGSRGYSIVVFITADDFRPIQLGLGFTLLGVGGMVAINRTFDENFLREGIKNDTLGTLLFPRDPVRNAPAIISALAKAFPARSGSYLRWPARQDRLVHADAGADAAGDHRRVRGAQALAGPRAGELAAALAGQRSRAHQRRRRSA